MKEKTAKPSVVKKKAAKRRVVKKKASKRTVVKKKSFEGRVVKKKFSGPLAKPIVYAGYEPGAIVALYRDLLNKLPLLFEHYGVEEHNWEQLVLNMAADFVPGFKLVDYPPPRRGRTKRPLIFEVMLLADIERLIAEKPGRSVSEAVSILVSSPRFRKRWGGKSKGTLKNVAGEALRQAREINKFFKMVRSPLLSRKLDEGIYVTLS